MFDIAACILSTHYFKFLLLLIQNTIIYILRVGILKLIRRNYVFLS